MNLIDGTCWLQDHIKPAEKLNYWDRFLSDRKRLEERLQDMAEELVSHGWKVEPPRVI